MDLNKVKIVMDSSADMLSMDGVAFASAPLKITTANTEYKDDAALDVGRLRIRSKGSAGGHNGLKDIIELLGSEEFPRIKLGVGQKPHPDYDIKDWVLGKFPKEQEKPLAEIVSLAADAVKCLVKLGTDTAMNRYNR